MRLRWSPRALDDLKRLSDFIARDNPAAAERVVRRLRLAPEKLKDQPRMGRPASTDGDLEVRSLFEGSYEVRYEILDDYVYILRI